MSLHESMEPPLSPVPIDGARRAPEPGAAQVSPVVHGPPPLSNRLLRMGLVTLPQLSAALQQQAETGRPLTTILVESGVLTADELAGLEEPAAALPLAAPTAVAAPPPAVRSPLAAAPDPQPEPEPAPPAEPAFTVVAELQNGARIEVATYGDLDAARRAARQTMSAVATATEWPLLGGRFVRPEAVLAIEVAAAI